MKKIIFIFLCIVTLCLTLPFCGAGQTITYFVEAADQDSILLRETVVWPAPAAGQQAKTVSYVLFRDTATLAAFVVQLDTAGGDRIAKGNALVTEGTLLKTRATAIRAALNDAYGGFRAAAPPPAMTPAPSPQNLKKTKPKKPKKV